MGEKSVIDFTEGGGLVWQSFWAILTWMLNPRLGHTIKDYSGEGDHCEQIKNYDNYLCVSFYHHHKENPTLEIHHGIQFHVDRNMHFLWIQQS